MDKTIADYRCDPLEFLKLPLEEINEFLELVCGDKKSFVYEAENWVESPFNDIFALPYNEQNKVAYEKFITGEANQLETVIYNCLVEGRWADAGMFMKFFKVGYMKFHALGDDKMFKDFAKVFPYGCFRRHYRHFDAKNPISSYTAAWALGSAGTTLISKSLVLDHEFYAVVLADIIEFDYASDQLYEIFTVLYPLLSCGIFEIQKRIEEIVFILSQKKFNPVGNAYDPVIYSCLAPYHYSHVKHQNIMPGCLTNIHWSRKPVWSRNDHLRLTDPSFKQIAFTVLCMQKFRYNSFPLHKDLIDQVLKHVFEMGIDDMKVKMRKKQVRVSEFLDLPKSEKFEFCLRVGININTHKDGYIDALDLKEGLAIPESRLKKYDETLELNMANCKGTSGIMKKLHRRFNEANNNVFGPAIVIHCYRMKYDFWDLWTGKFKMREADFELISGIYVLLNPSLMEE